MQVTPRSSLMIHFTFPSYVLESFPRMPLFMPCPALSCNAGPFFCLTWTPRVRFPVR